MSAPALRAAASAVGCPPWCHSHGTNPLAARHTCMTGVVLREPRIESVAVEVEQVIGGRLPTVVLSVFTRTKSRGVSAYLTVEEARRAHAALGEALRIAGETTG